MTTRRVRCTASALRIRELPDGADTGLRLIHGQIATAHGESFGRGWLYIDAPAGRGWSSADFLAAVEGAPAPPAGWPAVPHGLAQIRATFGEAASPAASSGRVRLPAPLRLGWAAQNVTQFACHTLVAPVFESVFNEVHRRGLWSLIRTFDGCYNDRSARGLAKKSTHAWGIAVDLNASTNRLGTRGDMDPRIVAIFRDHGCLWGGEWSRPDPMHFQYATGY